MLLGQEMPHEDREVIKKLFSRNRRSFTFVPISFILTSVLLFIIAIALYSADLPLRNKNTIAAILLIIGSGIIAISTIVLIIINKDKRKIQSGDFLYLIGKVTSKERTRMSNGGGTLANSSGGFETAQQYVYVNNQKGILLVYKDYDTANPEDDYMLIKLGNRYYSISLRYFA